MPRRWTGHSIPAAASNQVSAPSAIRPARGRISPAIAASVVLLPEPEGPKRIVIPGGAEKRTSSSKPPRAPDWIATSSVRSAATALSGQLVDQVERRHREGAHHQDHAERVALAVGLDRVVDRQRGGLGLARD